MKKVKDKKKKYTAKEMFLIAGTLSNLIEVNRGTPFEVQARRILMKWSPDIKFWNEITVEQRKQIMDLPADLPEVEKINPPEYFTENERAGLELICHKLPPVRKSAFEALLNASTSK
jgi:hypothetical protein